MKFVVFERTKFEKDTHISKITSVISKYFVEKAEVGNVGERF